MTPRSRDRTTPATPAVLHGENAPQRADAKRNAIALIEAAKTVFERNGVEAPAKEITDLAGVGVGTLYRHFPRRSDLIVAVMQHEIDECIQAAEDAANSLDPWPAVNSWIDRFMLFVGTKQGLSVALHSGDPAYQDLPNRLLERLEPVLDTLLTRALNDRETRRDVTARQVLTTVALISQPVPGEQPDFNRRMAQVFMDGLAVPATKTRVARLPDKKASTELRR